jgi:metal-responsive CopG/Arc/MetJ family transcriptional regulator
MPTSVHIPDNLLQRADTRAKALGISRNRLIVRALERELEEGSDWSKGFFELLRARDNETAAEVDDMLSAIRRNRRSKSPTQF